MYRTDVSIIPLSKPVYIFVCIGVRIIIIIVLYIHVYNYLLSISLIFSLFLILIFVCEYFFSYSSMLRTVAAVWVFAKEKGLCSHAGSSRTLICSILNLQYIVYNKISDAIFLHIIICKS